MTNLPIKLVSGLSILIMFSCATGSKDKVDVTFDKTYALKPKVYDTELLIRGGSLKVIDTFLIIVSDQPKDFCKVYSIPSEMKEVYGYGCIGNGPKEFLQPWLTYCYDNTLGVCEMNEQELAILRLDNRNNKILITEEKRLKYPHKWKKGEFNAPDYYFVKLNDTHYVSTHHRGQNEFFSLLDSTLAPINRFGEPPIPEALSILSSMNRLQGKIATYNGTMVFSSSVLPYLACYQLQAGVMHKQWSFFYDEMYYQVRNDDLLFSKETSFGDPLNLAMDSEYIYVLYLDQLVSAYDGKDPDKSHANKILVFDHKGNAVTELNLGCRIYQMALSSDKTKFYGIANLPEPVIVEFDLPKELLNER